jgi:hypothetical protein
MVVLADLTAAAAAACVAAASNTAVRFTDGVLSSPHCCKLPRPPELKVVGPFSHLLLLLPLLCSLPLPWPAVCSIVMCVLTFESSMRCPRAPHAVAVSANVW